jgi:hypothetical protein
VAWQPETGYVFYPGVNFINILQAPISYERKLSIFSQITIRLGDFLAKKDIGKKAHVKS